MTELEELRAALVTARAAGRGDVNGYRPSLSMRYGMPQPTQAQRDWQARREEEWLDSIRTLRKQAIAESVLGLGRKPIDPAALAGTWGRRVVKS